MHFFRNLIAALALYFARVLFGPQLHVTHDVAFTFRMGAGSPGDVNRTHPFSVVPGLTNTTTPPRAYGDAAFDDGANGYRGAIAGDGSATPVSIAGAFVRPYPTQQTTGGMSAALGAAVPPVSGVVDVCEEGFILVKIPAGQTVVKGGRVYVWCAATSGSRIQGSFDGAASSTNTVPVINARFNGPADATGVVEIRVTSADFAT